MLCAPDAVDSRTCYESSHGSTRRSYYQPDRIPSVVYVHTVSTIGTSTQTGFGSGVVENQRGLVLTNARVVAGAQTWV